MEKEKQNQNRLTNGSLTVGIIHLAGPMLLGAVLSNFQSLIDLYWVGRLGSHAVAGIAFGGTIFMMLFPVLMGMATGALALISRAIGAGDSEEANLVAGQSVVLSLAFGLIAGAIGWLLTPVACELMSAPPEVKEVAVSYLRIIFAGNFTICVLVVANSVLQGAGNTVIPTCAMALANVINIILDPILIFGLFGLPAMGIRGAAVATVTSQAIAAGIVMILMSRGIAGIRLRRRHYLPAFSIWWRLTRVGTPGTGQMLSRSLMSLVLMRVVAVGGSAAIAAYGIGLRFHMIALMPAFSLAGAAATLVGQNLGAKRPERAARAAWMATGMAAVMLGFSAVILVSGAPWMVSFFDKSDSVLAIGVSYLRIVSPFYVFAAMAIVLGRALMGAGDTMSSMVLTLIPLWGLQVPLALLLPRYTVIPTDGVWYAVAISVSVHGFMVAAWFMRGKWKYKQV